MLGLLGRPPKVGDEVAFGGHIFGRGWSGHGSRRTWRPAARSSKATG
ncbi:MAG: hypothetical protein M3R38_30460 [Actinomycetota bacterium]|nr:hypothetical protein [Actinomycetota bacterium]